jgi:hypothetical protein
MGRTKYIVGIGGATTAAYLLSGGTLALVTAAVGGAYAAHNYEAIVKTCRTRILSRRTSLRIMSWNIETLGGGWNKGPVARESVIEAIAALINKVDPDFCVVIEVMVDPHNYARGNGRAEIGRILSQLNAQRSSVWNTWKCAVAPGETIGETYAFFYRNTADITLESIDLVTKDVWGNTLNFPTAEYRRPGEARFRLSGTLAREDGSAWLLPLIAFHVPSPGHKDYTLRAVENLEHIPAVCETNQFPDCVICADMNSDEEARGSESEKELVKGERTYEWAERFGFLLEMSYDSETKTTLRKSVTAAPMVWRGHNYGFEPESTSDLHFSNYDQILTRSTDNGSNRLHNAVVTPICLLAAVTPVRALKDCYTGQPHSKFNSVLAEIMDDDFANKLEELYQRYGRHKDAAKPVQAALDTARLLSDHLPIYIDADLQG